VRVVFVGVVNSAKPALDALVSCGADIAGLFTVDLGHMVATSSMERQYFVDFGPTAEELGIPLRNIKNINDHADEIRSLKPDYMYIIGWPQIVRREVLSIAPCIGLHPAPLPKRRGGAPLNWQIIDGETQSAVSLLRLGEGVDDGDLLIQIPFSIGRTDYISDVMDCVCELTRLAVEKTYPLLATGKESWTPQDHSQATVTRRRRPENGLINWNDSSVRIYNLVRAVSHPFPGAFTYLDHQMVKIWRASVPLGYRPKVRALPGELLDFVEGAVVVSTRDYCLGLTELQIGGTVYSSESELEKAYAMMIGKRLGR
jgi:methionyl-tRNA formyltransferase